MNRSKGYQVRHRGGAASVSIKRGVTQTFAVCFSLLVFLYASFPAPAGKPYWNSGGLPLIPQGIRTEARLQPPMLPPAAYGGLFAELFKEEPGSGFGGYWAGIAIFSGETGIKVAGTGRQSLTRQAGVFAGAYLRKILYPFHHFP